MARRNGDRFWLPRCPTASGGSIASSRTSTALDWDQQGVEISRTYDVNEAEANSLINLGHHHTHQGEGEKALSTFHEVEACIDRDSWFRWRFNIRLQAGASEYWLFRGDLDKAEEHARRLPRGGDPIQGASNTSRSRTSCSPKSRSRAVTWPMPRSSWAPLSTSCAAIPRPWSPGRLTWCSADCGGRWATRSRARSVHPGRGHRRRDRCKRPGRCSLRHLLEFHRRAGSRRGSERVLAK